ncbi:MAG: polyprenyl synthetase family protein [Oligoflexus sp.]
MTLRKTESLDSCGNRNEIKKGQRGALLPEADYFDHFFTHEREKEVVWPLLSRVLFQPLEEFLARPSKIIRAALVHAGYDAAFADQHTTTYRYPAPPQADLQTCSHIIELLHSGSLIIDDLQDESLTRRGKECFHRLYGSALALTAGNWLYVWPLKVLGQLDVSEEQIQRMQCCYHHALEAAHYGQALDVSVAVDTLQQDEVSALCQWVTRYKTGTITVLALELGAILGGADDDLLQSLRAFGMEFGTLLQNYDDLANILGHQESAKRFEDFIHKRPSWVWSMIADHYTVEEFQEFTRAVDALPQDQALLHAWLERYQFVELAAQTMEHRLSQLKQMVIHEIATDGTHDRNTKKVLIELSERLSHVYTKVLEEHRRHR